MEKKKKKERNIAVKLAFKWKLKWRRFKSRKDARSGDRERVVPSRACRAPARYQPVERTSVAKCASV